MTPEAVLARVSELPGWAQVTPYIPAGMRAVDLAEFLLRPAVDLGYRRATPYEWLVKGGEPDTVVELLREMLADPLSQHESRITND